MTTIPADNAPMDYLALNFKLRMSEIFNSVKLREVKAGTVYIDYCILRPNESNQNQELYNTIVNAKIDSNLVYTIMFSTTINTFDKDSAYVAYTTTKYGEVEDIKFYKCKKERVLTPNNIFTEKIVLNEGLTFIIEDKLRLSKLSVKGHFSDFEVPKSSFKSCK